MYPGKGTVVLIRPAQTFYERINVGEELKEKRKKANATARQLATQQSGGKPSSPEWQEVIAQIWVRQKDRVFGHQVALDEITDPAEWDRLNRSLEAQLKEEER